MGDGRIDLVDALVDRQLGCTGEQVERRFPTDDGVDLQQLDGRLGEQRQASAYDVAHPGGHARLGRQLLVATPGLSGEQACQLADVERVALGPLVDGARRRRGAASAPTAWAISSPVSCSDTPRRRIRRAFGCRATLARARTTASLRPISISLTVAAISIGSPTIRPERYSSSSSEVGSAHCRSSSMITRDWCCIWTCRNSAIASKRGIRLDSDIGGPASEIDVAMSRTTGSLDSSAVASAIGSVRHRNGCSHGQKAGAAPVSWARPHSTIALTFGRRVAEGFQQAGLADARLTFDDQQPGRAAQRLVEGPQQGRQLGRAADQRPGLDSGDVLGGRRRVRRRLPVARCARSPP